MGEKWPIGPRAVLTYGGDRRRLDPYLAAGRDVGLEPIPTSPESDWEASELDGLVLTGGAGLHPARCGQPRQPETGEPDRARDEMEAAFLKRGLESDLPVLSNYRGRQLFPVEHGSRLIRHCQRQPRTDGKGETMPPVSVLPDTKWSSVLGTGEHPVN